jgi:methionyl-tRNA formyltransferase
MLKYLFMGSPPLAATILETLCAELHPPAAIVTQAAKAAGRGRQIHATAVEEYAHKRGLELIATPDINTPETVARLRAFQPDLILVAAFGQILKNDVLTMPKRYCLNVHASLLPKYRGAAPIQRAIWNGDKETGITIQKMAKKLDTGDILLQRALGIDPHETSGELMDRLAVLGGTCLVEAVRLIEANREKLTPQDESLATYAGKIDREDAAIDWSRPAPKILDQIRALQPWPVAETYLGKDRLKIFKASVASGASAPPGSIRSDGKTQIDVICGESTALSLTEIQLENRKKLDVRNFLMAFRGNFPFTKTGFKK